MSNLRDASFCVLDIETTGLDSKLDKIVEIAFVITTMEKVLHAVDTLVNPGIPIPAMASAIHHIVDSDVADSPAQFPYGIRLPERHCYVAHNAEFDSSFLPSLSRKPWMCTMRLAKRVLPESPSFTNQFLRYSLGLSVELPDGALPHRALPDALVTAALLRHLLAKLPEDAPDTVDGLVGWCAAPMLLPKCQFGRKHRGKSWSEIPRDYLEWMERECADLDIDTLHTVRHHLQR